MKKAISLLLAILLLLNTVSYLSFFVSASDEYVSGIWTYYVEEGYAVITDCSRLIDGKIVIPDSLNGYPVAAWEANWSFEDYEFVIPNSFPKNVVQLFLKEHNYEDEGEFFGDLFNLYAMSVLPCSAKAFTALPDNEYLTSVDGVLYSKDMKSLIRYPVCKKESFFILPDTVDLNWSCASWYAGWYPFYNYTNENSTKNLKIHISAEQIQSVYVQNRNRFDENKAVARTLADIVGFGVGAAEICTDWNNSIVDLDPLDYIFNVQDFHPQREAIPQLKRCNGHGVSSISVKTMPNKTNYYVGEAFDATGLSINVRYEDGRNEILSSGFSCSGFSVESFGTKSVTVSFGGKTTTFDITINPVTLTKIEITVLPSQISYFVGDTLNTEGAAVIATYSNGSTTNVTSDCLFAPMVLNTAGTQTITVSYCGKSTTFTVIVQLCASMYIQNPSTNTINYGYTLQLHAQTANLPAGASIRWSANGGAVSLSPSGDSLSCNVKSVGSGNVSVTAQLVDRNGSPISDSYGNAITSTQSITSRAGFFQRLAYFFKSLCGVNMNIPQALQDLLTK